MGIIAATAFILATQTPSGSGHYSVVGSVDTTNANSSEPILAAKIPQVSKARLDEIWAHIDNRVTTQSDIWFPDGQFPQCISLLRVQHAYAPADYDIMTNLGWMLENVSQVEQAREIYIDYNRQYPENGGGMFALGNSYYIQKDWDNTIKVLEPTLLKRAPVDAYIIVAKAYERKGKLTDALRIWELELSKYPNVPTASVNIKRVKAKIAAGGK